MIVAGYLLLYVCTPIFVRSVFVQSFNDLIHTCALTPLVFTGNSKKVPMSVFVYFVVDILFNLKTFMKDTAYFLHHIFGCFEIYLVFKYFMENIETLGFLIWLQETALIPITLMEILRINYMKIPKSLYVLRPLWYFSSRVYTYCFIFYNYDRIFGDYSPKLITMFCTPLILHNTNVFRLQIKSMLRVICE